MQFKDSWIDETKKWPTSEERRKQHFKHLQMESANRIGQKISESYGFRKREEKSFQGEDIYEMEVIVISPNRYAEFIRNLKDMNLPKTDYQAIRFFLEEMDRPDQPL